MPLVYLLDFPLGITVERLSILYRNLRVANVVCNTLYYNYITTYRYFTDSGCEEVISKSRFRKQWI